MYLNLGPDALKSAGKLYGCGVSPCGGQWLFYRFQFDGEVA